MGVAHSSPRRPSTVVAIVGLPGVGKSTIGRRVAKRLGWDFVDLDSAIEEQAGRPIREIFATSGEKEFRNIESEILIAVSKQKARVSLRPAVESY